jgi:hypothetical protein
MKTVIVVSKCQRIRNTAGGWRGYFAFKGFYSGEEVRSLHLLGNGSEMQRGEDCILYVKVMSLHRGVLTGEVLRWRRLEDLINRC